jgi:hypothetical protein
LEQNIKKGVVRMPTQLLKSWTPNTSYEFGLLIGNKDYSNDIVRISIRSSVATPYENILLEVFLDSTELLLEKIYGQQKIKLTIILKGETQYSDQHFDVDLMFLRVQTDYQMQRSSRTQLGEQIVRKTILIETLCRTAYTTMTTQVNQVYFGKTPYQIISDLVQHNTNAKLEYDINERNDLVIDQFLIPPSTLYRTIEYLNTTYGIFKGDMSVQCSFDNKVMIQNLSKKIQSDQALTVYQLATDTNQTSILESNDPRKFYTKEPVELVNRGNSIISGVGHKRTFIVKPKDQLYNTIDLFTSNVAVSNGIISKFGLSTKIEYDFEAIDRTVYHTNQTGYDKDESFAIARLAKETEDISMLSIGLQHNLPILNLLKTGSAINFIPQVSDYKPLGGMYVLKSSELGWIRSKVWESWARLYLMRANIADI